MKSLLSYIKDIYYNKLLPSENVYEMATISRNEKFGKDNYRVSIHGPASADRENPHIHIYLANDIIPYNKFNFEISLTDILCKDEINLIYQRDIKNHVMRSNRYKCSWDEYKNLLYTLLLSITNYFDKISLCKIKNKFIMTIFNKKYFLKFKVLKYIEKSCCSNL